MNNQGVGSQLYSGFVEIGFPLAVIHAVATTFVCGAIIYMGIKMKRGLINPPPSVSGGDNMTPSQKGNLMIGFGVMVAGIAWLWAWLAYRYKSIALLSSIGGLVTLISSLLHMKSTC